MDEYLAWRENAPVKSLEQLNCFSTIAELARDNDIVIGHSLVSSIPAGAQNLCCTVICREPVEIAMPESHRPADSATIRPRDLAGESWISVPAGFPLDTVLQTIEQVTDSPATVVRRVQEVLQGIGARCEG